MTVPPAQAATAALLARLAGGPPVETHISAVFLGADTVWKLRRAVKLAFVDFTTLAEQLRPAVVTISTAKPVRPTTRKRPSTHA